MGRYNRIQIERSIEGRQYYKRVVYPKNPDRDWET